MSSNGNAAPTPNGTSSAIDVGFSSVADQYGESSSRAESRSSGKRSSHRSEKRQREQDTREDSPTQHYEGRYSTGSLGHRTRRSGGFLLESAFANGSPKGGAEFHGKRKAQDGQLRVDKRRPAANRFSGDSSLRGSPLSRDVSMDLATADERDEQHAPRTTSMDPAQLVQMALNLSESRKRHVSSTLQVPMPSQRRVTSGLSNYGTVRATSSARKRTSQLSDNVSRDSPDSNGAAVDDGPPTEVTGVPFGADNVLHTFSPATLSRVEKARKYFELASEHRRLLQSLPPLKPDSSAPGNYTFETKSSPGSAFPDISRVASYADDKHALGRQYNPIQSLRNRRVRIREKRPFPAPPDTWVDPDIVKTWVDDVEQAATEPQYRASENRAGLPSFAGHDDPNHARSPEHSKGHRRNDTAGSVITRPENSWTIEPTELLADAYWTEQSDNKTYIESRRGNPIFPSMPRKSMDTPRISVEMHRGRAGAIDGGNVTDDEESVRPSRRHRLMMPLKGPSELRKSRRMRSRSPSSSSSSSSSTERRKAKNVIANRDMSDENIRPLERHMQELIAKDANGELSSPEMVSPADHWDSKNLPYQRMSVDKSHHSSSSRANGRTSLDVPRDLHRRTKSADGRVGPVDRAKSSSEDLNSEPASPVIQRHVPSIGMDLSTPPGSRRSLDGQRSRPLKLPSFRSNSKGRNKIEQVDFAEGAPTNLSPILSGNSYHPRSSQDSERPSKFKRHETNESVSNSLHRFETGSTTGTFSSIREPSSTVGRLFRGGRDRLGGLVRGDGPRFSDRFKNRDKLDGDSQYDVSRNVSDMSDVENETKLNGHLKKRLADPIDYESDDVSPRGSFEQERPKPKYNLSNLPSFTSSARDKTANGDHISQQQQAQREVGKPERFNRLAPPRINLPQENGDPDPKVPSQFTSIKWDTPRKGYGDLAAFGAAAAGAGSIGLSKSPGQRHWSIYDQAQPIQAEKITVRDIARVRALLLCSGIKAREIQRHSNRARDTPAVELTKAVETTGQRIDRVPLKEEHLVAARMLSDHLSAALSDCEGAISRFQNETAKGLAAQLDELQHKATDHLSTLVHETSDEADAFTLQLTTEQPQQTQRVDKAVDDMFKKRGRQFRFLRTTGFKLLEWLVLSIMWWIWFTVVLINIGKRMVYAVLRFLRWLFTF